MNDRMGTALLHGNAIKIASGPVVPPSGRAIDCASHPRDPFREQSLRTVPKPFPFGFTESGTPPPNLEWQIEAVWQRNPDSGLPLGGMARDVHAFRACPPSG